MRLLKSFWAIVISLAGVVGLYLGAVPLNVVWLFWVVVVIAAVVAIGTVYGPAAFAFATRARDYPRLLETAAAADAEVERLQQRLHQLREQQESMLNDALREGQNQVSGPVLATMLGKAPTLTGLDTHDGEPILLCSLIETKKLGLSMIGARYDLTTSSTGIVRGTVEVYETDDNRKIARLKCVTDQSAPFWDHLRQQAPITSTLPADLELVTAKVPGLGAPTTGSTPINEPTDRPTDDVVGSD